MKIRTISSQIRRSNLYQCSKKIGLRARRRKIAPTRPNQPIRSQAAWAPAQANLTAQAPAQSTQAAFFRTKKTIKIKIKIKQGPPSTAQVLGGLPRTDQRLALFVTLIYRLATFLSPFSIVVHRGCSCNGLYLRPTKTCTSKIITSCHKNFWLIFFHHLTNQESILCSVFLS